VLKSYPLLSRLFLFIVLPLIVAVFAVLYYFKTGLPVLDGAIVNSKINTELTIIRDQYGIPHVKAQNDHDAFFAVGYLHAQDRLWQMEMQRRLGSGQLSEVFGEASLSVDKYMRTLGLGLAAKSSWSHLNEAAQASLEAYVQGVNAYIEEGKVLPPEFLMFGFQPKEWLVSDSLLMAKVLAMSLSGGIDKDLERLAYVRTLGDSASELGAIDIMLSEETISEETMQDLQARFQELPDTAKPQIKDSAEKLRKQLAKLFGLGLPNVGSNSWVVSGKHTQSGKPILANDPHLASQAPSIWYLADINGRDFRATGATLPGLPYVIAGHNHRISWGITSMAADSLDLFIERVNPLNPNEVQGPNGMEQLTIRHESIVVKPKLLRLPDEPIEIEVRSSRHGPLISDVIGHPELELALSWSGLSGNDTTYQSMLGVNFAKNWTEFRQALDGYVAPTLNFVYADVEGNIGYTSAGHVPIRKKGNGTLPVPGESDEYSWLGRVPFDEMPSQFNPDSGVLLTANNKVVSEDYSHFLGNNWSPPFRANRIESMLLDKIERKEKITPSIMSEIQGDHYSESAALLLPFLVQTLESDKGDPLFGQALTYLRPWDAVMATESVAPTLYHAWLSQFQRLILADDIDQEYGYLEKPKPVFMINLLNLEKEAWCDNQDTNNVESCIELSQDAARKALVELQHKLGSDISDWSWGRVHKVQYRHMPLSDVRGFKTIFHREFSTGGSENTVNLGTTSFDKEFKYLQFAQPAYRQIIDLADLDKSRFINTPGQSGNIFSRHYDDMIEMHAANELIPMIYSAPSSKDRTFKISASD